MRLAIASDIHGAARSCEQLLRRVDELQCDRLVLLGDILYHGPRNDLPDDYGPKHVIEMLNERASTILCVRGNCEAEVDQMVLNFACMADYSELFDPQTGHTLFFTHGHIWGPGIHNACERIPALQAGDTMVFGHTHIKFYDQIPTHPSLMCFNPGSVGIPKDGTRSFGLYEAGSFEHVMLD